MNEDCLDFKPLLSTPQREVFPADAKNTADTEAIPYQCLFIRNLILRYFILVVFFFANLLHKIHCVKQSLPQIMYILEGYLNRLLKRNSNQADICLLA